MDSPTPTIGRVVYYVLHENVIRPAIITNVFSDDTINLSVQLDGPNDNCDDLAGNGKFTGNTRWIGSAAHDQEGKAPGTWHWMTYQLTKAPVSESAVPQT